MQGRHSLLLSLFLLFYTASTHAATDSTNPLRLAMQHPEFRLLGPTHYKHLKLLAAQAASVSTQHLHAASVLQEKAKQWATPHQRTDHSHKDTLAVALFCLVTDMRSTKESIADCQMLSFEFYQNALYMIQYFLDMLPHSVWDDPHLQTTLHNLHDIQNKAFRICPFTAAAYTHLNLLKHHSHTPQTLNEFLNPITAHSEGLNIVVDTCGDIEQLCKHTDAYIPQIFYSDPVSLEGTRFDQYTILLFDRNIFAKKTDVHHPLFLNLGCAPLLGKTFTKNTPLMPDVDYSDFPTYTKHLAALYPNTPAITFPNIGCDDLSVCTPNFSFIRLLLQHSLPLKQANRVCQTLDSLNNERNKHIIDVIDNITHSTSLGLAIMIAQLEGDHTTRLAPKTVWTCCAPSLVNYFGLWLASLTHNDYAGALFTLLGITKKNPGILEAQSSLISQPDHHVNSIDRFYARGPAKWLFLLTQVLGAALLPKLVDDNSMQLASSIRQAIQNAPWLSTPTASRF